MSVALMVEKINGVEVNDFIPVSNQQFFVEYWIPLCERHDLFWVPLFETGMLFSELELPDLLSELKTLQCHPEYDDEYFRKRLNLLIEKLETLVGMETTFFIG